MKMHRYGEQTLPKILMIHPMISSHHGVKECLADNMGEGYCYLLPDLSGHGASEGDFISAAAEAESIKNYLVENDMTDVALLFGASLGAVVAFELLAYKELKFGHIWLEGVSFYEHSPLINAILSKVFLKKHKKAQSDPDLCRERMIAQYGDKSGPVMASNFMKMSEQTIRGSVRACAFVNLPSLRKEQQQRLVVSFGSKDFDYKKAKKVFPKRYPYGTIKVWEGYGHCAYITAHAEEYAEQLADFIRG